MCQRKALLFVLERGDDTSAWCSIKREEGGLITVYIVDGRSARRPTPLRPFWICLIGDTIQKDGKVRVVSVILEEPLDISLEILSFKTIEDSSGTTFLSESVKEDGSYELLKISADHSKRVLRSRRRDWICARGFTAYESFDRKSRTVIVVPIAPAFTDKENGRERPFRPQRNPDAFEYNGHKQRIPSQPIRSRAEGPNQNRASFERFRRKQFPQAACSLR